MLQRGLTWDGVLWAFRTFDDDNYNPIAWLSAMLDVSLFGLNPTNATPQKFMSLGYHIVAMWLLLLLLVKVTGSVWRSGVVAALFALHPLHVEPVALVIVRKDELAALFAFLAMILYAHYSRQPSWRRYMLVMGAFLLALLSKATIVPLSCVFLLMDFWPLQRWKPFENKQGDLLALRRLILEKIPFLMMSMAIGLVAIVSRAPSVQAVLDRSIVSRLESSVVAYVRYLEKTFWPVDLCFFYCDRNWTTFEWVGSTVILLLIIAAAVSVVRRAPWVIWGILFFMGMLVPVSGIMQTNASHIADRYVYFPLTGIFIALVWSIPESWVAVRRMRVAMCTAGLILAALLAGLSYRQVGFWRNDRVVFEHGYEVEPDGFVNLMAIAGQCIVENRPVEALAFLKKLDEVAPNLAGSNSIKGRALMALGKTVEAEAAFRSAIKSNPNSTRARAEFAHFLTAMGRHSEAILEHEKNIQIEPAKIQNLLSLGDALVAAEKFEEAALILQKVIARSPDDFKSLANLGMVYDHLGRTADAVRALRRAIEIRPDFPEAHRNLGAIYARSGEMANAFTEYEWMVKRRDQSAHWLAEAHHGLGMLHARSGRLNVAITEFQKSISLNPRDATVHNSLGLALAQLGNFLGAADAFGAAVQIDPGYSEAAANLSRVRAILQIPTTRPAP